MMLKNKVFVFKLVQKWTSNRFAYTLNSEDDLLKNNVNLNFQTLDLIVRDETLRDKIYYY